jgi:hypothetical protein
MQKSLIRTQAEKQSRKEITQQNRQKQSQLAVIQNSNLVRKINSLNKSYVYFIHRFDHRLYVV